MPMNCSHRIFSATWEGQTVCSFCNKLSSVIESERISRLRIASIKFKPNTQLHVSHFLGRDYNTNFDIGTLSIKYTRNARTGYRIVTT